MDLPFVDDNTSQEDLAANNKHDEESTKFDCIMFASMSPEL